ncbi:MAG: PEP-CTERM sorting domain-containing protein [Gammaproteobacteria bacterium]
MARARSGAELLGIPCWRRLAVLGLVAPFVGFAHTAVAGPIDFSNCGGGTSCPYVTYGDAESYSLNLNALLWDHHNGGGTGPGNPFYVTSTPGAIKNLIVPATGASGGPVTTNFSGMDNAYPTPNDTAGTVFFTTNKSAYGYPPAPAGVSAPADPAPSGFTGDTPNTWDTTLSAFQSYLGTGNTPIFFFNNNQVNSGATTNQNLAVWAQITLTDSTGKNGPVYFDLTNNGGTFTEPGGGIPSTVDPTAYLTYTNSTGSGPNAGTNASTDYVMSGGRICLDAAYQGQACDGTQAYTVNNNLGADQAAYALVVPELNQYLLATNFGGYDAMSLDLRMGCDPRTTDPGTNCVGRSINNGYEQVFIASTAGPNSIPEPGTLALMSVGLLGVGLARRRKVH